MGQFSWLDCKNHRRAVLDDVPANVYLLVPKEFGGGHIKETCYDGYGHFGGHDVYDLVVDWNKDYLEDYRKDNSFKCDWLQKFSSVDAAMAKMPKREIGISIACYDEDNQKIKYPIKITHDPTAVYEDCDFSPADPNQGWGDY